ncbi:hypothetical protein ABTX62_37490 [Streptomyces sp. NPDC096046]|uniref:hypothetical protein n=1 Tax=Streptomyces sp. NPDC096046 TaxID=3155542 RepID=UPI0033304F92
MSFVVAILPLRTQVWDASLDLALGVGKQLGWILGEFVLFQQGLAVEERDHAAGRGGAGRHGRGQGADIPLRNRRVRAHPGQQGMQDQCRTAHHAALVGDPGFRIAGGERVQHLLRRIR